MRTKMKIEENPPEPLRMARQFLTLQKFLWTFVCFWLTTSAVVMWGESPSIATREYDMYVDLMRMQQHVRKLPQYKDCVQTLTTNEALQIMEALKLGTGLDVLQDVKNRYKHREVSCNTGEGTASRVLWVGIPVFESASRQKDLKQCSEEAQTAIARHAALVRRCNELSLDLAAYVDMKSRAPRTTSPLMTEDDRLSAALEAEHDVE